MKRKIEMIQISNLRYDRWELLEVIQKKFREVIRFKKKEYKMQNFRMWK